MSRYWILAFCLVSPTLLAGDISVSGDRCRDTYRVQAEQARLSDVLRQFADQAEFHLKFDPQADTAVSINREGNAAKLLRELVRDTSLLILEDSAPECAGTKRVQQVWVLPRGTGVEYVDYRPEPRPREAMQLLEPLVAPPVTEPPLPRGLRRNGKSHETLNELREKAKAGELVGHPDTGEPITREEYERIMEQREDEQ